MEDEEADLRIDAQFVIAWRDGNHEIVPNGSVVVAGDRIVYAGPRTDQPASRILNEPERIVAPGFVSTHTHVSDSPLTRSIVEDRGNPDFSYSGLYEYLTPIGRATDDKMALAATEASLVELARSGVTTVVEVGLQAGEQVVELFERSGLRAYVGRMFRSANWRVEQRRHLLYDWLSAQDEYGSWISALNFATSVDGIAGGRIRAIITPAQVDTCRRDLLALVAAEADRLGFPVSTHACQSINELEAIRERHGCSPIELLDDVGLLGPNFVLAHGMFTDEHPWAGSEQRSDLRLLAESGSVLAHCPWVFARRGIALRSFAKYREAGVALSLGVDSVPQSMLHEMRVAATVGKLANGVTQDVTAGDVFDAATVRGADALGRSDLGRLAPGALADLVCFRTDTVDMAPVRDPIKNIVYSATSRDVAMVMVAGRQILENGVLAGFDEPRIAAGLQRQAQRLWDAFPEHEWEGRSVDDVSPPTYHRPSEYG